jgi:DNA adenine methylase
MWYIGSKSRFSKYILPYILQALKVYPEGKYIEPFVGGANMIDKVNHHTRIGCDANKYLIALYEKAITDPDCIRYAHEPTRQEYNYIRAHKDEFQDWYVGLVGFMCTFSNNWMGTYNLENQNERFKKATESLLRQNLTEIDFWNCDYQSMPLGKGNVIYCDIPYRYNDNYHMPFKHEQFYSWVKDNSKNNIFLISEYYMPAEFTCIWERPVVANIHPDCVVKRTERLFICNT